MHTEVAGAIVIAKGTPSLRVVSDGGVIVAPDESHATRRQHQPFATPPVILLQGPVGGFFGAFARHIRAECGVPVLKVQFNLGDIVCDRADWTVTFRGEMADLSVWYQQLFMAHGPRAVVAFGDERPVHRVARTVCAAMGIPFFSFEEGYLRPNFVTLEHNGNNANSLLAGEAVPAVIPFPTTVRPKEFGSNTPIAAWRASQYFMAFWLGRHWFPGYQHHRERRLIKEARRWIRSYAWNVTRRSREIARSVEFAHAHAQNYFVLALQVYDDLQLVRHGRDWTSGTLITQTLHSFARHAPRNAKLLIKQHPLDTGHKNYARQIAEIASPLGIADRVVYLRFASLQLLLRHARGLVTVNSTAGISALALDCPVITMGDSLYAREGLAVDGAGLGDLDAFWRDPPPVDRPLFERFRASLLARTQINGDFYIRKAWPGLFKAAISRILHEAPHGAAKESAADSERHGISLR